MAASRKKSGGVCGELIRNSDAAIGRNTTDMLDILVDESVFVRVPCC